MKESSFDEDYAYSVYDRGDHIVVDDLAESSFAYAQDIGYESEERYEIRKKGLRLGRFETLEDAKDFLDG